MDRNALAQAERHALADLMVEVGPDHPTLNEGWTTADLVAHTYVRENKPSSGPGLMVGGFLAVHTERVRTRALADHSYEDLVARLRNGPPLLLRPFNGLMNLNEYFIHHEDVRRGDGTTGPRPADEIAELDEAIWGLLGRGTRLFVRKLDDLDITLARPDGASVHVGGGSRPVTITGRPTEIMLFVSGRRQAADVTVEGDEAAVTEAREGQLGI